MTTPRPLASSQARRWVNGLPRALISSRGRLSCGTVSMARASTSAFITMPGPPPAGVSSTVRCLSAAEARMSWVSSDQMFDASALPARLEAERPREHVWENGQNAGAPHVSLRPPSLSIPVCRGVGVCYRRHLYLRPALQSRPVAPPRFASLPVDRRHRRLGERQHHRLAAADRHDLDESPAPKLCSACTVPICVPSGATTSRPIRSA